MFESQSKHFSIYLLFVLLAYQSFPQGDSCADPIDLNMSFPIVADGHKQIPVDNYESSQFYTYTADKAGTLEMWSGFANRPGDTNFETDLRVYKITCDNLVADIDSSPGLLGNCSYVVDVNIGDTYIFEWSNHNWGGTFNADYYFQEPEDGISCDDPLILTLGENNQSSIFYDQHHEYTASTAGTLSISTCGYINAYSVYGMKMLDACEGHILGNVNWDCDPDEEYDWSTITYEITQGETILVKTNSRNHEPYDFNVSFSSPVCAGTYTQLDDDDLENLVEVDNSLGDHIFRYTATQDGTLLLMSCNKTDHFPGNDVLDTYVKLYELCEDVPVAESDDYCGVESRITFSVTTGSTYEIVWDAAKIDAESTMAYEFYFGYLEEFEGKNEEEAILISADEIYETETEYIEEQWYSFILPESGALKVERVAAPYANANSLSFSTSAGGSIQQISIHKANYFGKTGDEVFIVWNNNLAYEGIEFDVQFFPATVWSAGEWSNETGPETGDNVVIDDAYYTDTHGEFPANDLEITENGQLDIALETSLDVKGDLINAGVVMVESGASLLTYEANSITGNRITFIRNTRYADGRYSFVGSPVQDDTEITGSDLGSIVYNYDETVTFQDGTEDGVNRWINASVEVLTSGKGYAAAGQQAITFEGVPNTGTITYTGTYTEDVNDDFEGWNLVSNPYTAAIKVSDFLTGNTNIEGAVYFWDDSGSETVRGSNSDYIVANGVLATNTTPAGGESRYNQHVGSAQGFFVKLMGNSNTTVAFTEDMRVSGSNEDDHFFRKSEDEISYIRINLTDTKGLFKQTVVGWLDDVSDTEVDRRFDAQVFNTDTGYSIYTLKADQALAIQGVTLGREEIPLGFSAAEPGTYQIEIDQSKFNGEAFYLTDKLTNETIDLTQRNYSFQAWAGQFSNRFTLSTVSSVLAFADNVSSRIYTFDKVLHIESSESQLTQYQLLNLSGIKVLTVHATNKTKIDLSYLPDGVYLISDGIETKKIVLK